MLRRLSILVRKPSQSREEFARAWEHHGSLVRHLPGVRAYQQNHVLESFGHVGSGSPFRLDGIVELSFDSMEAMQDAFASAAAVPVKADEPNFLGHGTGFVGATPQVPEPAVDGRKLIIVGRGQDGVSAGDVLQRASEQLPNLRGLMRDDVVAVIARPELAEGPQHADVFLHLYFPDADEARRAGRLLVGSGAHASFDVVRVRTVTVV